MTSEVVRETRRLLGPLNDLQNGPQDEGIHIQIHELMRKIAKLEPQTARQNNKIKNCLEGETMTKFWICLNKVKPRDIIFALKKPSNKRMLLKTEKHMKKIDTEWLN
jgi:hypothetical protein